MAGDSASSSSPVFDPQVWVDLLTVHALKRDMFSTKTLMAIHEGVEQLAAARSAPNSSMTITHFHQTLFERLQRSFNNPTLLKEVGILYLREFGMPGVALKHFDLARQFAPKDHDIEDLQKSATMAMARTVTDQVSHSGLSEAAPSKVEVGAMLRKTTKLAGVLEMRKHLTQIVGVPSRKPSIARKTGSLKAAAKTSAIKKRSMRLAVDFSKPLNQAKKLVAQTDFAGAFEVLEDVQKQGAPKEDLTAAYSHLGLAAFDNGCMEEALQAFLLTRDLTPESVEGWFNCGLVYQKVAQMDDALVCYQEAAKIAPENPKTWCNISSVQFERGDYAEAEKAARQAVEIRTDYARAWDNLAAALSALNRLPEAAEACQQAIHFQPSLHGAWFKYGVVNFQLDNLVMAMEAFALTGDNPDYFPYVLYYMSMIEARRGELDLALQKLTQARHADPENYLEPAALKEVASAFGKAGRHVTAASYYSLATTRCPDDFSAWLSLGTAYHRADQVGEARESYRRATELQPENPVPWHNLGLLASDEGDLEEARNCFQREVDLAPDDAKAWYDLGVSLQALGQEDESAEAMERAEGLVKSAARTSSDLSAALSIVRRINLGERVLRTE